MNIYISPYSVGKSYPYCPIPNLRTRVPWLASLWLLVPPTIRAFTYDVLRKRLPTLTESSAPVRKIWPGIVLKSSTGCPIFEAHALLLVKEFTCVPSPTLFDIVVRPGMGSEWGDTVYILMSEIPGHPLSALLKSDELSTIEKAHVSLDIRRSLDDLRNIPNPYPNAICSAGGPELWSLYLQDYFNERVIPAMDGVTMFHAYEKSSLHPTSWEKLRPRLEPIFKKRYEITFTHGDLNPSNIMVHKGRVSGLVDWEYAGWMPEYWDFVAAMLSARYWDEPFKKIMEAAGMDDYMLEVHGQLSLFILLRVGGWDDIPPFDY